MGNIFKLSRKFNEGEIWLVRYQLGGIWGRPRANKCKLDENCDCKAGNGELEIHPWIRARNLFLMPDFSPVCCDVRSRSNHSQYKIDEHASSVALQR